jgi:hypothetical protein
MNSFHFIKNTILTVLLWVGLWGLISLVIDHYLLSFESKIIVFSIMTIISFYFLILENKNNDFNEI